ncbi:unnamed protein product [Meloidogyne enterolobii]|uniref:Uncharacterized protein n=1 Tax=Meloidogyne enterolobii TaxID=390850 RepID=A0ACB1B8U2_MELEN
MDIDDFLMIRGSLMIAAMKQISLSIDIDESAYKDLTKINDVYSHLQIPNFFNQFAFIFDPSTLIFGPFITYTQFLEMKYTLEQGFRECNYYNLLLRLLHSFWHLIIALFFLLLSSCFVDTDILSSFYFLPSWLIQFTKALAFRYSHYFVCYFATSIVLIGGASYSLEIVRWTSVEWPGSLAQVASVWNIPMHSFLHKCKFLSKTCFQWFCYFISYSNYFCSLFFITRLRERLAISLSACIRTRLCPNDGGCLHRYKSNLNPLVILPRVCFLLINGYQLVYLGALIHNYDQFQWDTWINEFKLFGHLLGLIMLLFCILFDHNGIIKNAKQEKMQYKKE